MRTRQLAAAVLALGTSGCGLTGPSCLGQQQRGTAATVNGEVEAGAVVSHLVMYDTRGSQNDVRIVMPDLRGPYAPRILLYATRSGCTSFQLPPLANSGECTLLATAGSVGGVVVDQLTITQGRGNPETLGPQAEYRLWVAGDPSQRVQYTLTATWFFGPDC